MFFIVKCFLFTFILIYFFHFGINKIISVSEDVGCGPCHDSPFCCRSRSYWSLVCRWARLWPPWVQESVATPSRVRRYSSTACSTHCSQPTLSRFWEVCSSSSPLSTLSETRKMQRESWQVRFYSFAFCLHFVKAMLVFLSIPLLNFLKHNFFCCYNRLCTIRD